MKTNKKILAGILTAFLFIVSYLLYYHYGNYFGADLLSVKTPKEQVKIMRNNYRNGNTKRVLENFTVNKFKYDIEAYEDIIENAPPGTKNLNVHFIQLTDPSVYTNTEMQDYKDKLYIAFQYVNNTNNQIGNVFILDEKSKRFDINSIFPKLKKDFDDNIRSQITILNDKKNTEYVMIDLNSLKEHLKNIREKNELIIDARKVEFELTEEFNYAYPINNGQLTFFTNIKSILGKISDLSEYNMNSLCPNQCP